MSILSCGPSDANVRTEHKWQAGQRNLAILRRDGHHGSSVSHSVPVLRCAEPVAASSKIMLLDLATEIAGAAGSALADHGPATARFPRSRPTPATCLTQLQPPEDSSPLKIGRVSGCAEGDLASPRSTTGQKSAALRLGSLGRSSNLRTHGLAHAICTCMGHHIRDYSRSSPLQKASTLQVECNRGGFTV